MHTRILLTLTALFLGASLQAQVSVPRPVPVLRTLATLDQAASEYPESITRDRAGNLYLTCTFAKTVKKVTPAGAVSTFASINDIWLLGITTDAAGNLTVAGNAGVWKVSPAGVVSKFSSVPGRKSLNDLVHDAAGNLYVTDDERFVIWKLDPAGRASLWLEHPDFVANDPTFPFPVGVNGIAFSPDFRTIYATNTSDGKLLAISVCADGKPGRVQVLAQGTDLIGIDAVRVAPTGELFVANNIRREILRFDRDGNKTVIFSGGLLNFPTSLVLGDTAGTFFICNNGDAFFSETPGVPGVLVGSPR